MSGLWTCWLGGWLLATAVAADSVSEVRTCLNRQDMACAEAVVNRARMRDSRDPNVLATAARVDHSSGRYVSAMNIIDKAVEAGFEDKYELQDLYRRTVYATANWVEVERGRFRFRYKPGVDAVLIDDAYEALERTDRYVTPLLGAEPPGSTIVELYPDGRSFIAASSLTKDDVDSTGVVALSKWSRLLVSSPRALGRGYDWQGTLSHEYIHLVVAHNTDDEAPVWLQEAIAKYLDNRWEHGTDHYSLGVRHQGYLARALAEDGLVPFEEMHPSLAKIKVLDENGEIDRAASSERSALAYSQLSTLMQFCFAKVGDRVLLDVLPAVRDGADPREALAKAVGYGSLDELLVDWEAHLRRMELIERQLDAMPTVLDGGSDAELDPVLSRRKDLANYLRLGDLLYDRGRFRAALTEYGKAKDEEDPNSPLLANRVARAQLAVEDPRSALRTLRETVADYPDYPLTHKSLGFVHRADGQLAAAVRSFSKASTLNPFDADVQQALLELARETGDADAATDREKLLRILRRGGDDLDLTPLHTIEGEYELPRSPEATGGGTKERGRSTLEGKVAPPFEVTVMGGDTLRLSQLRGKVVLLDFWATWCGPCRKIMPGLSDLQKKYADDVVVLGISDELTSTVERFLTQQARRGVEYAQTIALESGAVRKAYNVRSLPTLYVVDRGGRIRLAHVGAGDLSEIEDLVKSLISGAPEPAENTE